MKWTTIAQKTELPQEIVEKLLACEKNFDREKFAREIELLSDPYFAADTYTALVEALAPDDDSIKMLLCMLYACELTWDKYQAMGIPEEIYTATMRIFTRCINEAKVYAGEYLFDRASWVHRQVSMTIFRVGALEYELKRTEHKINIHIPSDADFSPTSVKASFAAARDFIAKFFPEFVGVPYECGTWLLSDVLEKLLPANSNILQFQKMFNITSQEHESTWYIRFLFQQQNDTPYEQLRESTSLQRKAKQLLLSGGNIGTGAGVVKMDEF